jgi:hypothetical protein
MALALPVAILLFAQAASGSAADPAPKSYGPVPVAVPIAPATPAKTDGRDCVEANKDPNARQIMICAPRPQGYRLDPDVLQAKREKKAGSRPHNPHEDYADHSCATVGPMGCRFQPSINLIQAATVLAQMANTAITGGNVGKMFETEPTSSEYQLYVEAKKQREAKEAEAAAAKVKAEATASAKSVGQSAH